MIAIHMQVVTLLTGFVLLNRLPTEIWFTCTNSETTA